jgi:hypothetical protein
MFYKIIFLFSILFFSVAVLFIPEQITAQRADTTVCSLDKHMKIDYSSIDWNVTKQKYETPDELQLVHKDYPAVLDINYQYYFIAGVTTLPDPAVIGKLISEYYSKNLQDFQVDYSIVGPGVGEQYYIEDPKFVYSNPAFLLPYSYTESTYGNTVYGIDIYLLRGSNIYQISFRSDPSLTSTLWPTIEEMVRSFNGSFESGDHVIDIGADGKRVC